MQPELPSSAAQDAPRRPVIVSISSDIGAALARRWLARGCKVTGTFRTPSQAVEELKCQLPLVRCDLTDPASVAQALNELSDVARGWDALVVCSGSLDPVGPFMETSFDVWEQSLRANCTGPLRLLRGLLPLRVLRSEQGPSVLFFAGSGTNGAAVNYSAYTAAKIALIKMCELLDAEIPDTRFTILGTGWVKTKIHEATLRAGARAGDNYQRTLDHMAGENCTTIERVLDCCDWVIRSPRALVGGRNFSVVHDHWDTPALEEQLAAEPGMYKLRRAGNDWVPAACVNRADEAEFARSRVAENARILANSATARKLNHGRRL